MLHLRRRRTLFQILLVVSLTLAVVFGVALGLALAGSRNFVIKAQLAEHEPALPTRILDVKDRLITEFFGTEKRELISLNELPRHLINALLTREDRDFYHHHGFSIRGMARALVNIALGRYVSGASTITQQLAGKLYADRRDISIRRKIVELWYAIQMERQYTKDEILEMYLNEMDFGHNTQGIEAASWFFFGHSAREATLAESAMLVIQLNGPNRNSPFRNVQWAKDLQKEILDQMVSLGYATRKEADDSFIQFWAHFDWTRPSGSAYTERDDKAPYFSEYIRGQLEDLLFGSYDYLRDGLVVHTTLDLDYQKIADEEMSAGIDEINARYLKLSAKRTGYSQTAFIPLLDMLAFGFDIGDLLYRERSAVTKATNYYVDRINPMLELLTGCFQLSPAVEAVAAGYAAARLTTSKTQVQGALITLDSHTGEIRAMVGGRGFTQSDQLNRAVNSAVQPGSAFKPLYYSAAIASRKFTAATMILDQPVQYVLPDGQLWEPQNFKGQWKGRVLLRNALADSMNVPAVKVFDAVGYDAAIQMASRLLGVTDPAEIEADFPRYPSTALGIVSVSPLKMARAYATIANQGREVVPIAIRYIEDRNGKIILEPERQTLADEARKGNAAQIMSPQTAYIMTSILQSTIKEGTLEAAASTVGGFGRPTAGKTGTTGNWSAIWTAGFTPQVTTTVWFGFDLGGRSLGTEITGATAAGPVWASYMKRIHQSLPVEQFPRPATGLVDVNVCPVTGELPTQYCPPPITEVFIAGTEPKTFCQFHQYESERDKTIEQNLLQGLQGTDLLGGEGLPGLEEPAPQDSGTGNPLLD